MSSVLPGTLVRFARGWNRVACTPMILSRRAMIVGAASAARVARAADAPRLLCPLAAEPGVVIPGVSDTFGARLVGGQIYRGLLRWGPGGTLEPDLATAIDLSADGLRYTVQLRPGVTWHDSGGFGAADVAFSLARFNRALQPGLRLGRLTIDTPGPLTVVLGLPAPDPLFPRCLTAASLPIVPQHIHDRPGWALDPKQTAPVGTGPFRMDTWLNLVRFEWYAGPKPALPAIGFPVLPEPRDRTALVEGLGPVLLVGDAVDLPSVPRLRTVPGVTVEAEYPPDLRSIAGLRFNVAVPPLDQREVRLALACAIDRAAALREGWSGLGRVATELPGYDLRAAAEHLRAGGLRPDDTGIRARLTCLLPPGPAWPPVLGAVRRSLAQVGVELVAEAVTDAEWKRRVAAGEYQIAVFTMDGDAEQERMSAVLPLVEPAVPVVRPSGLRLPRGALGSFEGASLG